jgi:8-oxo-dGTP diphosphatase
MSQPPLPEVCVCYLLRPGPNGGEEVLLGRKKTGLGAGHLVGPGGKLEAGESPVDAAVREVHEEVGLVVHPADLRPMGHLVYPFPHAPKWSQKSWVFIARRWEGEARESDELAPVWIDVDTIPLDEMWDDARYWLPATLHGAPVDATFTFGPDGLTVESSDHPHFPGA